MSTEPPTKDEAEGSAADQDPSLLHRLGEAIHDHVLAAEVAAEEAAGYGPVTAAVEAAEAGIDPAHELGAGDEAAEEPPTGSVRKG